LLGHFILHGRFGAPKYIMECDRCGDGVSTTRVNAWIKCSSCRLTH
jgi:hypothetical protein